MKPNIESFIEHFQASKTQRNPPKLNLHQPHTLLLCCSDARSDPAIWFESQLNELFIIRTPGNVIPEPSPNWPCGVVAGIIYAAEQLPIEQCIIMGHSQCGGANHWHAKQKPDPLPKLTEWMETMGELSAESPLDPSQQTLIRSYQNLIKYPCIKSRNILCHALYLDVTSHTLSSYDQKKQQFFTNT